MNDVEEYAQYRKRRIAMMKKIIIMILVILILLPTVLCVILFIKLNKMQKQLNTVMEVHSQTVYSQQMASDATEQNMDGALHNENIDTHELKDKSDIKYVAKEFERDEKIYSGKRVYLTFDDGPSANTDVILGKLAEYNVKATFFVVMKTDEQSVERYRRIVAEGHTLAMHSATHVYSQIYSSMDAYISDLSDLQNYLEEITGKKPMFYRFPGGSSNTVSEVSINDCVEYLEQQNIVYFDWNVASGDAAGNNVPASVIASNVISGIMEKDDSVVLLHDTNAKATTVEALDEILQYMADTGMNVLPITEGTTPVHHRISK